MKFNPGTVVTYIDVEGKTRKLKCIEHLEGLVKWHKTKPKSEAALYECEDGHVIQIPNNAWSLVKVIDEESI